MNVSDLGIILEVKNFKEKDALVKIFSENHGIFTSFVNSIKSKSNQSIYLPGNLIEFQKQSRLSEHLGVLKGSLIKSYVTRILYDRLRLLFLTSIIEVINILVPANIDEKPLFEKLIMFLENLNNESKDVIIIEYIFMEIFILKSTGFGINLETCVICGLTTDLHYLSPKSGHAVCIKHAEPYMDKLIKIPLILYNKEAKDKQSIEESLDLTEYFFKRYLIKNKEFNYRIMLKNYLCH